MTGTEHTVEGVSLGETTVSFSAVDVKSSVVHVRVFAPLKLSPRNVTLVLGATLQVVISFQSSFFLPRYFGSTAVHFEMYRIKSKLKK